MRNENIAVNPTVETGPLTRRRFMGVAAMLAPGLCVMGPEGTAPPEAGTMFWGDLSHPVSWDRRALGITAVGEMRKFILREGWRREVRKDRRQFYSWVRPQEMIHPLGGER